MTQQTMPAARLVGNEDYAVETVARPALTQADDVLLRIELCGVCGSDVRAWRRGAGAPGPAGGGGHEAVGTVVEAGEQSRFAPGDRVTIEPPAVGSCGTCGPCQEGARWFCEGRTAMFPGAYAEFLLAPDRALFAIPDELPDRAAILAEPVACGVHAMRSCWSTSMRGGDLAGVSVAVIGAGLLGLGAVMAAAELGADQIVVLGRHPQQRHAALAVGATDAVSDDEDGRATIKRLRPQIVVEAAGSEDAAVFADSIAGRRGEVIDLAAAGGTRSTAKASRRELRYFHAIAYAAQDGVADIDMALQLLVKHKDAIADWDIPEVPLAEIQNAFAVAGGPSRDHIRVAVRP
ncbi:zinc-dependent alcohol dehydrogenase [Cumulibacter soli]|uniref:zinc-dependent alcohol dehydrogenase n=1 Tax=Cumulibacter soli TaxID=2546344 RepID=UPI00141A603E|nr:alcohol dehydrogenase catalytic domain-containing protein [Cumulibacter soli]